jgi:hypothetical protein
LKRDGEGAGGQTLVRTDFRILGRESSYPYLPRAGAPLCLLPDASASFSMKLEGIGKNFPATMQARLQTTDVTLLTGEVATAVFVFIMRNSSLPRSETCLSGARFASEIPDSISHATSSSNSGPECSQCHE